jgi:hypothetical protein
MESGTACPQYYLKRLALKLFSMDFYKEASSQIIIKLQDERFGSYYDTFRSLKERDEWYELTATSVAILWLRRGDLHIRELFGGGSLLQRYASSLRRPSKRSR